MRHLPSSRTLALLLTAALPASCAFTGAPAPLPTTTLEAARVDPGVIATFLDNAEAGRYGHIDHFILMRGGQVVVDEAFPRDYDALAQGKEYGDGQYEYDNPFWHPFFGDTDLHTLQSVTKSVTSLLIGIAIDDGAIPGGVASPAMQWFGDFDPDMSDPRRADMTLEDILTMQSGIDWQESIPYEDPANSCIQLEASEDWIQFIIDQPMREEPGTRFDYNSGASVLLGKILREATGQRIDTFARERLFQPLGIESFHWKLTPKGEVDTEGGLYLRSEDLARIAQLVLQRGEWDGERIVSAEWIETSTRAHVPDVGGGTGYGYQWWIPQEGEGLEDACMGGGFGGQYPVIVPELDVVAVLTAWDPWDETEKSAIADLFLEVLPGIEP